MSNNQENTVGQAQDNTVTCGGPGITTPAAPEPPRTFNLPTDKVTTINMDEVKENSVLIITINVAGPEEKMAVAPVFSKLLAPYAVELRKKHVTVMLMTANENLTNITEAEMNAAGWHKKEESLIITPDKNNFRRA